MTFDSLRVTTGGVIEARFRKPCGGWHRKTFTPGADVTSECSEVIQAAAIAWTPEVVAAWKLGVDSQAKRGRI